MRVPRLVLPLAIAAALVAGLVASPSPATAADAFTDGTGDVCTDVADLDVTSCTGTDASVDISRVAVELDNAGNLSASVAVPSLRAEEVEEVEVQIHGDGVLHLTMLLDVSAMSPGDEGIRSVEVARADGSSVECGARADYLQIAIDGIDFAAWVTNFTLSVDRCIDVVGATTWQVSVVVRRTDAGLEVADRAPDRGRHDLDVVPVERLLADTCDGNTSVVFGDVPESRFAPHANDTNCIANLGVAEGFVDGTFRPAASVTAGQVAILLSRILATVDEELPASSTCGAGVAAPSVGQLVDAGVFDDCDAQFDATRSQMAGWVAAVLRLGSVDTTSTRGWFDDDDGAAAAEHDALAELGVVLGTGERRFRPDDTLTRGQMATLLARTLDALLDRGAPDRLG